MRKKRKKLDSKRQRRGEEHRESRGSCGRSQLSRHGVSEVCIPRQTVGEPF